MAQFPPWKGMAQDILTAMDKNPRVAGYWEQGLRMYGCQEHRICAVGEVGCLLFCVQGRAGMVGYGV